VNEEMEPGTGGTEPPETGSRSEETVGEMLLAARERTGMSLEEISQETKIPASTLRYLETDNFEAIPAKVYAKGFLRAYAGALGLDPRQVLNKYEVQTGQTHRSRGDLWEIEEQTVEEQLPRTRLLRRLIIPAVVVVIIVIVLVKIFGGGEEAQPPPDLPDTIPAAGEQAPGSTGEDSTGTARAVPAGEAAAGRRAPAEQERTTSPAAVAGGTRPEQERQPQQAQPPADEAPPAMRLRIVATDRDTTWFDVVLYSRTENGLDSIPRDFILFPGNVETLQASESILLRTVGNAGGFRLELDGRALPTLGERGKVRKNVRITRSGISGG